MALLPGRGFHACVQLKHEPKHLPTGEAVHPRGTAWRGRIREGIRGMLNKGVLRLSWVLSWDLTCADLGVTGALWGVPEALLVATWV